MLFSMQIPRIQSTENTRTLPQDIISQEILPRLPTKSLFRFKCVSKSWQTLISSPDFVTLHRGFSPRTDSECLLVIPNTYPYNDFYVQDVNSRLGHVSKLRLPKNYVRIVGSSNGLLCMKYRDKLVVINPLTGSYREVSFDYPKFDKIVGQGFGFGYDSVADDYKIVRVLEYYVELPPKSNGDKDIYHFRRDTEVTVYSLRDNCWRMAKNPSISEDFCVSSNIETYGVVIDNNLVHWIVCDRSSLIICFDLVSENWMESVPLPDSYSNSRTGRRDDWDFGVLDECLSLCLSTEVDEGKEYNQEITVWIMKEYGVKDSWVKVLHLSSESTIVCPIVYSHLHRKGSTCGGVLKQDTAGSRRSGDFEVCLHRPSLVHVCSPPCERLAKQPWQRKRYPRRSRKNYEYM